MIRAGDFSALGWLEDLTFLADAEIPESEPRFAVGFGFGGVLALHLAAQDERIAGIACLGTPDELGPLVGDPEAFLAHCRRTGVITSPDFPESVEAWAKELSVLHPAEDAALLKGRPDPAGARLRRPRRARWRACAPWSTRPPGPPNCTSCWAPGTGCVPTPGPSPCSCGWLERRH